MLFCLSIFTCIIAILILIFMIVKLKIEMKKNLSKFVEMDEKKCFLHRECVRLKSTIVKMEKDEIQNLPKTETISGNSIFEYSQIFAGKTALIGNYDKWMAEQTRKMLRAFGLSVDVVYDGNDIIDKIQNGCDYDIIFTNNVYKSGIYGSEIVHALHQIEGFDTPVVVHTISTGQRNSFLKLGFDEYLEKPIKPDEMEEVLKKCLRKKQKSRKQTTIPFDPKYFNEKDIASWMMKDFHIVKIYDDDDDLYYMTLYDNTKIVVIDKHGDLIYDGLFEEIDQSYFNHSIKKLTIEDEIPMEVVKFFDACPENFEDDL